MMFSELFFLLFFRKGKTLKGGESDFILPVQLLRVVCFVNVVAP